MGKNKQGQRTKNNARPSSSGRSAEMLGTAPLNPFLSFSSLKESLGVDEQQIDSCVDPNFQVVLKKMNKKDATTKHKALQEFAQLCDASEPEAIVAILPFWPRLYSVLAVDVEHRVREAAHVAHRSVVTRVKRNVAPYLKQLAGPWFVAQCDPHAPAASAATRAFNETFPANKMSEAIAFCQEEILNYITENLIVHTPQTLSNPKTMTAEEMEAKYLRTIISSLQGYGLYLNRLSSEQLHAAESHNRKLVTDKKFWKFSKHQSPQVRSAWFGTLTALCQQAPFIVIGEEKNVGLAVFGALDESDATVLPMVWEAALVALLSLDDLWGSVSLDKLVLPKLLRVCQEAGKGSASVIFPSLLPLLSKMPNSVVGDAEVFHKKFFNSIQQGFDKRSVQQSASESRAVASAFTECLQYVARQYQGDTLFEDLVLEQLEAVIRQSLTQQHWAAHVCDAIYSNVSRLLHAWGKSNEGTVPYLQFSKACDRLYCLLCNIAVNPSMYTSPVSAASGKEEPQQIEMSAEQTNSEREISPVEGGSRTETPKIVLAPLLKSQVKFINYLLEEKQVGRAKVKFVDMDGSKDSSNAILPSKNMSVGAIIEIKKRTSKLCCTYLRLAKDSECPDYLTPLVSLVKSFNSLELFQSLATSIGLQSEEALFPELLSPWLREENAAFCRSAISLTSVLLVHLPSADQDLLLHALLQNGLKAKNILWMIEDGVSPNGSVSRWLRSPELGPVLCTLVEEAISKANKRTVWDILCSGSVIASDGDHIFCNEVLQKVFDVVISRMQSMESPVPLWISPACSFLLKLYTERSPFLRTLGAPQDPLSVAFKVCLCEPPEFSEKSHLSKLWREGATALARMYGPGSPMVLKLCSTFRRHIHEVVIEEQVVSIPTLLHVSSLVTQFIFLVRDCFSDMDDDEDSADKSSKLLSAMLNMTQITEDEDSVKLQTCIKNQVANLSSLADCILAFYNRGSYSQSIPQGSQMELVSVGSWSFLMINVLHQLSLKPQSEAEPSSANEESSCSSRTLPRSINNVFCEDFFFDAFLLFTDIHCTVVHYAFTELGSAWRQPRNEMEQRWRGVLAVLNSSQCGIIHSELHKRSSDGSVWERAHKEWHRMLPDASEQSSETEGCDLCESSVAKDVPPPELIEDMDLSPLDTLSGHVLLYNSNSTVRDQALLWLNAVNSLHMLNGKRVMFNCHVQSCSPSVVHDTLRVLKFLESMVLHLPDIIEGHHWDQVMIALASWTHSAHETVAAIASAASLQASDQGLFPSLKICAFLRGVCRLFVAFNNTLKRVKEGTIELGDGDRGLLKESLPREWNDVFAGECEHKLLAMWTTFVENLGTGGVSPPLVSLLDELGLALQYASTTFLVSSPGTQVNYEPVLGLVPPYLLHNIGTVRLAAYHLLLKVVPHMVQSDAETLAAVSSQAESGEAPKESAGRLSLTRFEDILNPAQTIVTTMLSDFKIGTSCTVQPFTDAYTYTSGYLLTWSLMLEMCRAGETELRYQYAMWLKNSSENYAETLLRNVFCLLPQEILQLTESKKRKSLDFFIKNPKLSFGECWSTAWVEHLACNVLFGALGRLPALARQWWTDSEPKSAAIIERVVAEHLSPQLCLDEMAAVAKMQDKAVDNMVVRVHHAVREVVATYSVDDLAMELVVRLPLNHPLGPMIVEVGKRNAAAAVQWRQWLMQLTMFLTHQNGSLWDGLALWRNNVVRRYEGVEECYICFCVLSGSNYQLPKLSCRTCRKKFHSTCLYKWFQTSNKSTCPICRNLF